MIAITDLFEDSVNRYSKNVYLWEKKKDTYKPLTYIEVKDLVYKFAAGLIKVGINKGDCIALLSEGRNEWVIGELGILYTGAVNVPLSVKLNEPSEILFRIEHSGSRVIIVSQSQVKKIQAIKDKVPGLKIIIIDKKDKYDDNEIYFYDVMKLGEEYLMENQDIFKQRWQSIGPNDYATICYTSGTTADPKGIILTHRNYTSNVEHSLSLIYVPDNYVTLLILPWDHSFAHTTGIYTMLKTGSSIASVQIGKSPMETLKNIPVNIKEIKPHFLLSVPALANNFKKNIETGVSNKGKLIESLFKFGLKIAYLYNGIGWNRGKNWRMFFKPIYYLMDKIIFSKVRLNFGGRLLFFVGGGALLDIELQKFFYAIRMPMFQGYGLTEASPVISANSLKKHKLGSSGCVAKNIELKICDENGKTLPPYEKGEIIIRGENVMAGYWRNPEATAQTVIDGWLHTGDMGYLDEDGFLYVLGRFKSLLIADDGEKYSPESIEEAIINHSQHIDQCMLYNNQNPYTVALIVPNIEAIKRWLKSKYQSLNDEAIISALKLIESEINEFRKGKKYGNMFPHRWLPASIAILDEPFSEENNLLNSTLKLVRSKVAERYNKRLKYLYTAEAKNICNHENIETLLKLLK